MPFSVFHLTGLFAATDISVNVGGWLLFGLLILVLLGIDLFVIHRRGARAVTGEVGRHGRRLVPAGARVQWPRLVATGRKGRRAVGLR